VRGYGGDELPSPSDSERDGIALMNHAESRRDLLSRSFLLRVALAVSMASLTHLFEWKWLRFATSEIILRAASQFGLENARASFDTVWIHGTFFQFAISCTFIDVVLGAIPLLWNGEKGLRSNLLWVGVMTGALFSFNILRLTTSQLLYRAGVPWQVADGVLSGISYFAVWVVITRRYWRKDGQKGVCELRSSASEDTRARNPVFSGSASAR
jgi:hypothetical protein